MSQSVQDQIAINAIRFLSIDMVQKANSGHPGAPMGLAPTAYTLWSRFLNFDPEDSNWLNRDRFILSCGHASALLYSLLHLSGYDLPLEELKRFRQLGSATPGHPEYGHTPGVETTTGPLGQGFATAVGMALSERWLGARFNRPDFPIFDHHTWVIASDGDLMEGVALEACSFAGHQRLGKLNVLYDDNKISIDGSTELAFTEDVAARFAACGWQILRVEDGNDIQALEKAMAFALRETSRPSLISVQTTIGYGSPAKAGTADAHGAPLGAEEIEATRKVLEWEHPEFSVPDDAYASFQPTRERGTEARQGWQTRFSQWAEEFPNLYREFMEWRTGRLPANIDSLLPRFSPSDKAMATRKASGQVLNALAPHMSNLLGGSADLAGSNNTSIKDAPSVQADNPAGRNLHFGIREHAMGAIMNGMALSGMLRPYGGTFLVFCDYMRPAIRLAALMKLPVVYVLTHDSIFLGEDGPTHQPISQILSLRAIPGVTVLRPADACETVSSWKAALHNPGPTALILSRQNLAISPETAQRAGEGVAHGAYILAEGPTHDIELIFIATGSEVSLALEAHHRLAAEGISTRVVSMPSWELFERQDADYRVSILPPTVKRRLAIEAGSPLGWSRWVGDEGSVLGIDGFGASAPAHHLAQHFGFTVDNVIDRAKSLLG